MQIYRCPTPNEAGKFLGIIHAFPDIWKGKVLDVGCRGKGLKQALEGFVNQIRYVGFDLHPPADVLADLEKGLPFRDKAFDVVVALDVLEHIDALHGAFEEICRISSNFVILTLPNMYELRARLKFLTGRPLSGKYGLPITPPLDRHRWLFSLREAREFVHKMGERCGFQVRQEGWLVGPRRGSLVGPALIRAFPNLFAPWYLALLARL